MSFSECFIVESISIQSFRQRIRTILRVVNESISLISYIVGKLQDGAVYQGQSVGTFWTIESESIADSSETTSSENSSQEVETDDTSQTISTSNTDNYVEGGN